MIDHWRLGERGIKELQQILGSLPWVKAEKKRRGNTQRAAFLETINYQYDRAPMLIWNQVDLKMSLEEMCREFAIQGDMEIDDGNSFSYSVIVKFPQLFFAQVIKN